MRINVEKIVAEFQHQHPHGFTSGEIEELITENNLDINRDLFDGALMGITCMRNEAGETIIYPVDVVHALKCGLYRRTLREWEWD